MADANVHVGLCVRVFVEGLGCVSCSVVLCICQHREREREREELHVVAHMAPNLTNACPASGCRKAVQGVSRIAVKCVC